MRRRHQQGYRPWAICSNYSNKLHSSCAFPADAALADCDSEGNLQLGGSMHDYQLIVYIDVL